VTFEKEKNIKIVLTVLHLITKLIFYGSLKGC